MAKAELQLISAADMYLFFQKGMRGRVSYISEWYSKANNKYLKFYDPKQGPKHIIYLDVNKLYGHAATKSLPTGGFRLINYKKFHLNKHKRNCSKDCVLEVDLEYPKELCQLHNDYALVPNKIKIKEKMLSKQQVMIPDVYNIPASNFKKRFLNFLIKKSMFFIIETYNFIWLGLTPKKYNVY